LSRERRNELRGRLDFFLKEEGCGGASLNRQQHPQARQAAGWRSRPLKSTDRPYEEQAMSSQLPTTIRSLLDAMPSGEFFDLIRAGLRPDAGFAFHAIDKMAASCRTAAAETEEVIRHKLADAFKVA
jgi:hypothetical protein